MLQLKALQSNKIKTSLIYLSLLVTIVSIFLITSISQGIISMYSNMLQSDGDIIVTQSKISDTFFSNVDKKLMLEINNIQGVTKTSALIVGASPVENLPIVAIYGASNNAFSKYRLVSGKYPRKGEVIVGETIFKQLLNHTEIQIANKKFHISGVFTSNIGFENGGAVMILEDAGTIFNKSASMLLVNVDISSEVKQIIQKIQILSTAIDVKSTKSFVDNYNQFKIINKSSLVISLVAFIMGLIAIASIMSITVIQRRDEFGIMKALGITSRKIAFLIISEELMIAFASFVSAYLVAILILYVIKHSDSLQGYVNGEIDGVLALYVFLLTVLMTIIGSLIPVVTALRVDPIILIQRGK